MNPTATSSATDALFGANGVNLNIVFEPKEIAMIAGAIFGAVLFAGIILAFVNKRING